MRNVKLRYCQAMTMLHAELIGRESEIRTLMTAFDAAGCRARSDGLPLAVAKVLATSVASGGLALDEAGRT